MQKIATMQDWQKVIIGMVLGILVGISCGESVSFLKYFGVLFLNMIKMVTIPLIFCTIIYGMTSVEDHSGVGNMAKKAIFTFICTAIVAACIGLGTASLIQPGNSANKAKIIEMLSSVSTGDVQTPKSMLDFVMNIIPSNFFQSLVQGNILQVIVFAFFCGAILSKRRSNCENLIKILHEGAHMLFGMIEKIMKLAPFGVFGYMASLVAIDGIGVMFTLSKLVITIIIACAIQYCVFGLVIMFVGRVSPIPFYKKIFDIQLLAFSTSSSKAVLVPMMNKCEKNLGVSKEGSRFILPLSAALNMDGGAIYQAATVVFFSQVYGISLGISDYLIIIVMSTIASIGGAGIPSGVLLFLGMVLNSVGMPVDGVLLIAAVDRILDMFTTVINVTGDIFATIMVEISDKKLNKDLYNDMNPDLNS